MIYTLRFLQTEFHGSMLSSETAELVPPAYRSNPCHCISPRPLMSLSPVSSPSRYLHIPHCGLTAQTLPLVLLDLFTTFDGILQLKLFFGTGP